MFDLCAFAAEKSTFKDILWTYFYMYRIEKINYSDWLGVTTSSLCAVHCTLTPLFFATRPILENTLNKHGHGAGFWALLDYLFLGLSLIAVWYSARHTSNSIVKWIFWSAWSIFTIGLLSELFHISYGKWLMYVGSFMLIGMHLLNLFNVKKVKLESDSKKL
ncbi:MerC domain-containing protein [uncultured Aquimarina sp.]|uniref:MerC domain-containing protein n=1 Tax=uncultured Aquimarina sp. TaxID=575652 RepID=UPI00262BC86D|nr:MerC domain-containing protein [uncultured Aquimarina sp.]